MTLSDLYALGGFGSPLMNQLLKILGSIKNDELVTIYGPEYDKVLASKYSHDILLFPIEKLNLPLTSQDKLIKDFHVSQVGEYLDILSRGLLST